MNTTEKYCVATVGEANIAAFHSIISRLPGEWSLILEGEEIRRGVLDRLSPRAIFFPHWRWKVPADVVAAYECIAFHASDLPFGRGGSPIQNMIGIGKKATRVTAFRMTDELDAGPIYMQRDLSLDGPAHEIFQRASLLVADMISEIVEKWPTPTPQTGQPTYFRRRTPAQSVITSVNDSHALYDLIRMLDAPDYPHAFAEIGNFRIEFTDAVFSGDGVVEARATIVAKSQ
jgi:methionyl-tRNA formyltransferase